MSVPDGSVSAVELAFPSAPLPASAWRRKSFGEQIGLLEGWLGEVQIGLGHSFGAWLLLAAAEQRVSLGAETPPLVLWNSPLGRGSHLNGALVGYRAPRSQRVRAALGLDPLHRGAILPTGSISFVFERNNRQAAPQDTARLAGVGFSVLSVEHSGVPPLEDPRAVLRAIIAGRLGGGDAPAADPSDPFFDDGPTRVVASG
jgi:hypothetical protein